GRCRAERGPRRDHRRAHLDRPAVTPGDCRTGRPLGAYGAAGAGDGSVLSLHRPGSARRQHRLGRPDRRRGDARLPAGPGDHRGARARRPGGGVLMPAATLTGTMPHRSVTAEDPDRVVPLAPRVVEYLCGRCEITTTARLHPQASIPQLWPCRRCRAGAECTIEPDTSAELIGLPAASKLPPRKTHWEHV